MLFHTMSHIYSVTALSLKTKVFDFSQLGLLQTYTNFISLRDGHDQCTCVFRWPPPTSIHDPVSLLSFFVCVLENTAQNKYILCRIQRQENMKTMFLINTLQSRRIKLLETKTKIEMEQQGKHRQCKHVILKLRK